MNAPSKFWNAKDAASLSALFALAWPVVVSRLGVTMMGMVDAVVLGRYSAQQLGFHTLGWAPAQVVMVTAMGLLGGVQVMTARAVGRGDALEAGAVLKRGLAYAFWLGLGSSVLVVAFGAWSLRGAGVAPQLAAGARGPMLIFSLSMGPTLMFVAATSFVEGQGRPLAGTITMWAANIVNLALNLVLVPGAFGLPALGAVGAAWATFGARAFMLAVLAGWIFSRPEAKAMGLFQRGRGQADAAREQRVIGFGAGVSNFVEVGAFSGMSLIAGGLGGDAVAAWAVVLSIASLVFMIPLGLASATTVMVGQALGAGDDALSLRHGRNGFALAAVFGLMAWAAVALFPNAIAGLYLKEARLIPVAASALFLAGLFFLPDGLQVVIAYTLRARSDVAAPSATHLISYGLVMLPVALFLTHGLHLGLTGIVWSVILASYLSATFLGGRYLWLTRRGACFETPSSGSSA